MAGGYLSCRGLILRRGAAKSRGDIAAFQPEPVLTVYGLRLVGKTCMVKGTEEPIAALVASKHPPGAVSAVGRRSQPHEQEPCIRITKAGQRLAPVLFAGEAFDLRISSCFPPCNEARTEAASGDLPIQVFNCQ